MKDNPVAKNARHVHLMKTDPEYNARVREKMRHPNKCKKNKKGPKSESHKKNISKAALARPRISCKNCGKGYTVQNIAKHERSCK